MGKRAVSPELIAAYRATSYVARRGDAVVCLRVGECNDAVTQRLRENGVEGAAFLTAYNPYSRPLSAADNAVRQAQLLADLRAMAGLEIWDGEGQGDDGLWPAEPSFFIWGISRAAAEALALRYAQNAFIWVEAGAAAELVWL